jgi:hypothetical protein
MHAALADMPRVLAPGRWRRSLLLSVAVVASLTACASGGHERSAASTLTPLRTQVLIVKDRVARVSGAARDLVQRPDSDLAWHVDTLEFELGRLQSQLSAHNAKAPEGDAVQLFSDWEVRLHKLAGEVAETREQPEAVSAASVDQLRVLIAELGSEVAAFVANLTAAETYLETNGTPAGVQGIAPKIEQAIGQAPSLLAKLDRAIAQIDLIQGRAYPAPAATSLSGLE